VSRILAIPGSLRLLSHNRALLRAAADLSSATFDLYDPSPLPLYNEDLETAPPAPVLDLRARIRAADALLFATPEYNFSISGVLKNVIDWGSQPLGANSWDGKPAAILGAAPSSVGTARAQLHLRQILAPLNVAVMPAPEFLIGHAHEKFHDGVLTDEPTRAALRDFLAAFDVWTRRFLP